MGSSVDRRNSSQVLRHRGRMLLVVNDEHGREEENQLDWLVKVCLHVPCSIGTLPHSGVSTDGYPGHLFVSHPTILFPFRIALSKEHFPLITEKGSQVSDSSLFRLWHLDDTGFLLFVKGFYVRQVLVSIPGTVSGLWRRSRSYLVSSGVVYL